MFNIFYKLFAFVKTIIMKNSIEKTAISIGKALIENGAEISRCEDTIIRVLKAHGCRNINVFCTNSMIILQTENATETAHIYRNDLDLFAIDEANSFSRCLCNNQPFVARFNKYPILYKIVLTYFATSCFCLYFGGSVFDSVFAGIIGLIIDNIKLNIKGNFAKTLCYSIIGGFLCYIPCYFFNNLHVDKIMIGTIMLLIPGLTIGNAIRDVMNGDTLSGLLEMTQAIFSAIAIAMGYGVSLAVIENI